MEREMMHHSKYLVCSLALYFLLPFVAKTERVFATPHSAAKETKDISKRPIGPNDGERVFKQNCARCHQAPQGFAPQVSGTIVRHMRVRASLSRKDERELLKFLNP
jgi:mono/diheme cytochrome c family protein